MSLPSASGVVGLPELHGDLRDFNRRQQRHAQHKVAITGQAPGPARRAHPREQCNAMVGLSSWSGFGVVIVVGQCLVSPPTSRPRCPRPAETSSTPTTRLPSHSLKAPMPLTAISMGCRLRDDNPVLGVGIEMHTVGMGELLERVDFLIEVRAQELGEQPKAAPLPASRCRWHAPPTPRPRCLRPSKARGVLPSAGSRACAIRS